LEYDYLLTNAPLDYRKHQNLNNSIEVWGGATLLFHPCPIIIYDAGLAFNAHSIYKFDSETLVGIDHLFTQGIFWAMENWY